MVIFKCPNCGGTMRQQPHYGVELRECDVCGEEYLGRPKLGKMHPVIKKIWEEADPDVSEPAPEVEPHDRTAFRIEGKTLRKYLGSAQEVRIPHGVERIGKEAFAGNKTVGRVIFPATMKIVGSWAFAFCESLKEIVLNDGLERLCQTSIWTSGVEELDIPDSVTRIDTAAIGSCRRLKALRLPRGIKELDAFVVSNCDELESLHIPASVGKIGIGLTAGCNGLKSITIDPENPRYCVEGNCVIEKETGLLVAGCIVSVIPDGVKEIGSCAFESIALKELHLPASVEVIGLSAFCHCNALEEVVLPHGVRQLQDHAFGGCESLRRIYFPKSITSVWYDVFQYTGEFQKMLELTVYCADSEAEWKEKNMGTGWCRHCTVVWEDKV